MIHMGAHAHGCGRGASVCHRLPSGSAQPGHRRADCRSIHSCTDDVSDRGQMGRDSVCFLDQAMGSKRLHKAYVATSLLAVIALVAGSVTIVVRARRAGTPLRREDLRFSNRWLVLATRTLHRRLRHPRGIPIVAIRCVT